MVTYGDVEQYVVVTGGIMSGLGKGITASSIGILLYSTLLLLCTAATITLLRLLSSNITGHGIGRLEPLWNR